MFKIIAASAATVVLLGACTSLGIQDGGGERAIHRTFQAPVGAQQALARAQEQMQQCLRGSNQNSVRVSGDPSTGGRAEVYAARTQNVFARADVKPAGPDRADVTLTLLNASIYDADAAAALRESIEFGVPTCRAYMPRPAEDGKPRRR